MVGLWKERGRTKKRAGAGVRRYSSWSETKAAVREAAPVIEVGQRPDGRSGHGRGSNENCCIQFSFVADEQNLVLQDIRAVA